MTLYVALGVIGLVALLLALLAEGVFDALPIPDLDGWLSIAGVAAFLSAFGFVGALLTGSTSLGGAAVAGIAAASGVGLAAVVGGLTRSLQRGATDDNVTVDGYLGARGTVLVAIPHGGMGEVSLVVAGHRIKLSARSDQPLPGGTPVVVVSALSSTAVQVTRA